MEKAIEKLKVGDVVEHSGGYNCTQTQFYIIEAFNKSGKKAMVRRLSSYQVDGDWMNGNVAPRLDSRGDEEHWLMVKESKWYSAQVLRGRINHTVKDENGAVKWVNHGSIENFYKWDGKPIWNNCD